MPPPPIPLPGDPLEEAPLKVFVSPPDGEAIANPETFFNIMAKKTGIFIIADGQRESLMVQHRINELIEVIKPQSAVMQYIPFASDKTITIQTVMPAINDDREYFKAQQKMDKPLADLFNLYEIRFSNFMLNNHPLIMLDHSTSQARQEWLDHKRMLEIAEELAEAMPKDAAKYNEMHQFALPAYNRLSTDMEQESAKRIKATYDLHKNNGPLMVVVQEEHAYRNPGLREQLQRLGIPPSELYTVAVRPSRDLADFQKGGQHDVDATIFVWDRVLGKPLEELGGKIFSPVEFPTSAEMQSISDIRFVGRPNNASAKAIILELVTNPKDPVFGTQRVDIAMPGATHPRADVLKLTHGGLIGGDKVIEVDVPVKDLPVKAPGEPLSDAEKQQWLQRLQPGLDKLRRQAEERQKAAAGARETQIPHHGLDTIAKLTPNLLRR